MLWKFENSLKIFAKRRPPAYLNFVKINKSLIKTCHNNFKILTTKIHVLRNIQKHSFASPFELLRKYQTLNNT